MKQLLRTLGLLRHYCAHRVKARSPRGHGVHSPMVYSFCREVLCAPHPAQEHIRGVIRSMSAGHGLIDPGGLGAGSAWGSKRTRLRRAIGRSSVSMRRGRVLHNICRWRGAARILELGTGFGVSALHMALARPDARLISLEGDPQRAQWAKALFAREGLPGVEVLEGPIHRTLPQALAAMPQPEVIFVDADHSRGGTLRHLTLLLPLAHPEAVIAIDDIRWSAGMRKAWDTLRRDPRVTVSIDLFQLGVLILRAGMPKQHFAFR